jgi:predicted permease
MNFGQVRRSVRRIFRLDVRRPAFGRSDALAELESYLDARVEQLVALGWTPDAARHEALRRLGAPLESVIQSLQHSAELRERRMNFQDHLEALRDDLRFAFRGMMREKVVAGFIVATLALSIGANAAMFAAVDRLLIRGPEYIANPARVMRIFQTTEQPAGETTTSYFGWVTYDHLRKDTSVFSGVAAYSVNSNGVPLGTGADAHLVPSASATYDLFPLLGVRPRLGRFYSADEDSPVAPRHVVVLSDRLWRTEFAGSKEAIGQRITIGDERYTIIGVAPRGFTGPQLGPVDLWMPMSIRSQGVTTNWTTSWNAQWLQLVARLAPGVSAERAAAEATRTYRAAYTGKDTPTHEARIWAGKLNFNGRGKETPEITLSRWLVGVALIVLLIACSNVANLLLARAVRRRREVAVRVALGSGRNRLIRLLLTESLLLAVLGGVAGLAVAWVTGTLLRSVLLPGIEWPAAPVDMRVLGVSAVIALVVGLITGLAPALRSSRPDLTAALKSGARDGGSASRLRGAFTVAQAALSLILLTGAGLFVRSLDRVRSIDLGIQPDRVLVVAPGYPTYASRGSAKTGAEFERRQAVTLEAVQRLRALPGVEQASVSIGLPFQSSFGQSLRIAGWDSIPAFKAPGPSISAVGPKYFETMGSRVLEGRTFTEADHDGSEPVTVVSQAMAKTFWPGRSAIGQCVYWSNSPDSLNTCSRVVGVVADAHAWGIKELPALNYYIPFGQERGFGGTTLLVRPKPGAEAAVTRDVRKAMVAVDPSISFVRVAPLQDAINPQLRPWKLGAAVFTLMAVLALIVAAVGLYSVMSYHVAQRTREIGVRMALGAQSRSIVMMVVRASVLLAGAGIAIGVIVTLWAGHWIEPLLFDTSPREPSVMGAVVATLLAIAIAASAIPAARARRVDPIEALRAE